jgi:hypothetical protein
MADDKLEGANMLRRTGLRIRCDREVHPRIKKACINFAIWLRINMEFPIRVVVYIKKNYQIKSVVTKELLSSSFFGPDDKRLEPYIRVATGDFNELTLERGEENAITAILNSVALQVTYYQQWIEDRDSCEEEAEKGAWELVEDYYSGTGFIKEIMEQKKVWTIENVEGVPTTLDDGEVSMPFWSSKLKTEKAIRDVTVYHEYRLLEISLDDFINKWLPELEKDALLVGANLNGKNLIGADWKPKELLEQIQYYLTFRNI